MRPSSLGLLPTLAAALLSTGCASTFLRADDSLEVVTDPPGATARVGDRSVVTPGELKIPRQAGEVVVRIEKAGYEPRLVTVKFNRAGLIWADSAFLFGGVAAGFSVDAVNSDCTFGDCKKHSEGLATGLALGAAVTAAAAAIDLSSEKTYTLERDELVIRLQPVGVAAISERKGERP